MSKKRISGKGSVAIDATPLPEMLESWIKMPVKKGRVSESRGKYFLTIGKRKIDLYAGIIIVDGRVAGGIIIDGRVAGGVIIDFRKLVGKEVYAAFSGSSIVAIGVPPKVIKPREIPCYWILCYYPVDIIRRIRPEIRNDLISKMAREGIISTQLAQELRREF